MDRALDPDLLRLALGGAAALPSAEEVGRLLANAELALLLHGVDVEPGLVQTAWYLHGVASSIHAVELYGIERQRACFRVAAHIFDLALKGAGESRLQRLRFGFAAQVAYLRSELDPNAIAIYKRDLRPHLIHAPFADDPTLAALESGTTLLGMDTRALLPARDELRQEIEGASENWGVESFYDTPFATAAAVVLATRRIARYLVYGQAAQLDRAQELLLRALADRVHDGDRDSRWVAYHLLSIIDGLRTTSVWAVLPPHVPDSVKRAFALAPPQVLTLWPPQLELFDGPDPVRPLDSTTRRLFLATPTSGGKTLIAQLIIAAHVASDAGDVCYVAPTRTLCREVRVSLTKRLRYLSVHVGQDAGDVVDSGGDQARRPTVEVMTPERLSQMLRADAAGVLERFRVFIFDEIHNVDEDRRGWTLESTVAYLHHVTKDSQHRIVLMSAAVGNRYHFVEWLGGAEVVRHKHSDWRGPRRLHCIWTTAPDWDSRERVQPKRKGLRPHEIVPLYGHLHARIGHSGQVVDLSVREPVGQLEFAINQVGRRILPPKKSTPNYRMLLEIAVHLAHDGPVLIVEATRPKTILTARALAERLGDSADAPQALVDLVALRLGAEHPLVAIVRAGVAYHHGSLPTEIRQAIEDAVSSGTIQYLVATTTMTEGVNLPVRSVIVASQGAQTADGYSEYITGSTLINAIGRAGRATRETEGVVVLARQESYAASDFERLNPGDENTRITSWIATEAALAELAAFEQARLDIGDAIIEAGSEHLSSFIAFVWFIAAHIDKGADGISLGDVEAFLSDTLGWAQLSESDRSRWKAVAASVVRTYEQTDVAARRRWASTDRALSSSRVLADIAKRLADKAIGADDALSSTDILQFLIESGSLQQMLQLREAPKRHVFTARGGKNRLDVTPPLPDVLEAWIEGHDHLELAKRFFSGVADVGYRFEQLGDYLNDFFEVYLPSCVATVIAWTNELIAAEAFVDNGELPPTILMPLPTELAAYIRLGVNDRQALDLLVGGLSSRRLALAASAAYTEAGTGLGIREWLGGKTLGELKSLFLPSLPELRELTEFSRNGTESLAARIVAGETVRINCELEIGPETQDVGVVLGIGGVHELEPIEVSLDDRPIGFVPTSAYADLADLTGSGLLLDARVAYGEPTCTMTIRLIEPEGE